MHNERPTAIRVYLLALAVHNAQTARRRRAALDELLLAAAELADDEHRDNMARVAELLARIESQRAEVQP